LRSLGYPAIRRTYRSWVTELAARDEAATDALFRDVIADKALPAHFRDDTIVALLRAASAAPFLDRHRDALLADDSRLLRLVIRLLRVGCVASPAWLDASAGHPSALLVPDGPSWAGVLCTVAAALPALSTNQELLLGLIEDWARGVTWRTPYPDGAPDAAAIALGLLPLLDDYDREETRKRVLAVLAKIPNAAPEAFRALLAGEGERASSELRQIVLEGLAGTPAARDMPDEVVAAARDHILQDSGEPESGSMLDEVELQFGVRPERRSDYSPPSAYSGPFLTLFRRHPTKGIAFANEIFGHSAQQYAHPRARPVGIESPFEVTLTFADGTTRTQWCSARLWLLYRGTSTSPEVLQCILMALERMLLEVADAEAIRVGHASRGSARPCPDYRRGAPPAFGHRGCAGPGPCSSGRPPAGSPSCGRSGPRCACSAARVPARSDGSCAPARCPA
jgi:hypothetical protein